MTFRYFRPTSLTWWAGAFAIVIGGAAMGGAGEWANQLGSLIAMLSGGSDASPAALISLGLGMKIGRAHV